MMAFTEAEDARYQATLRQIEQLVTKLMTLRIASAQLLRLEAVERAPASWQRALDEVRCALWGSEAAAPRVFDVKAVKALLENIDGAIDRCIVPRVFNGNAVEALLACIESTERLGQWKSESIAADLVSLAFFVRDSEGSW
jgi:hypothetical protein